MADIAIKLKLDGESTFNKKINEATSNIKDLDKELELSKELFKQTGDKETYMKNKGQILTNQIKLQEQAVEEAKKALEECGKQGFDENSRKTMQWRGKLSQAQTKLVRLYAELENNKKGLDENGVAYDEAGKKAGAFRDTLGDINKNISLQNVSDAIGKVNETINNGIKKAVSFGKALWDMTADSTAWADDLATNAAKTGIDTTTLQQWEYAARFIDTDVDAIIAARNKLMKGGDNVTDALTLLGIDPEGKDSYDVMWEALEALGQMESEEDRSRVAMDLFGKSYAELLPLIKAGREEWDSYANHAPVVSEADLQKLTEANDALEDLDANLEVSKRTLLAQLAPALKTISESLTGALKELNEYLQTEEGQEKMQAFSDAVVKLAQNIFDIDWGKAIEGVGKALDAITGALQWIIEHKDLVVAAFTAIFAAKLFSTLGTAATNIGKLYEGLKGVLGISGGPSLGGAAGAAGSAGTAAAGGAGATGTTGGVIGSKLAAGKAALSGGAGVAVLEIGGIMIAAEAAVEGATAAVQQGIIDKQEETAAALEEAAAEVGETADILTARAAMEATGAWKDEDGNYRRTGMFGWGYNLNTKGQSREILMGLGDRKNQQMAELYNLMQLAPDVQGESAWTWLQRLWDPRYGLEDWEADWQIDEGILDEVAEAYVAAVIAATGQERPTNSAPKAAAVVTDGEMHDLLMGLSSRKGQQLAQLQAAVIGAGGQEAWNRLMQLWKQDNLTQEEVEELYAVLTEADSTIIETAARRAAETAAEENRQAMVDKLMGLQSRQGQQRAQLFAGLDEQQQAMLSALWNGGTLSAADAFSLYGAVFGVNGVNLTRPGNGTTYGQEGIDADEMAGIMASALSQATVDMDGKSVGKLVAPYVSEILARQMNDRW